MENREAIASLKTLCNTCTMFPKCVNSKPECFQAIETAISALEKQEQDRWIPVAERLPEKEGCYLVTIKYDHERRYSKTAWYCGDGWITRQDIIAWRLTPEPYKAEEES